MDEEKADLVAAWHEAALAIELAQRLAALALAAADEPGRDVGEAEAIATLAEQTAESAAQVATTARDAASRARRRATAMLSDTEDPARQRAESRMDGPS
jgi:hypothetical protein